MVGRKHMGTSNLMGDVLGEDGKDRIPFIVYEGYQVLSLSESTSVAKNNAF